MEPTADSEDVIVDLLDVLLQKGVVLEADVVIGIADIPLVGIKLRAAIAGLTTMREYGMFEEWDLQQRRQRRSHAPIPGGSITGRPADSSHPDGASRPRHVDRPAGDPQQEHPTSDADDATDVSTETTVEKNDEWTGDH